MHIESLAKSPMTTSDFRPLQTEAYNEVLPVARHDGSCDCRCSESPLILNSRGEHSVHFKA